MATKRNAEDFAPGINDVPSQAPKKCHVPTEVSRPQLVRIVKDCCFSECEILKTAKMPNSIEVIGKEAFFNCANLTDVTIARDQPGLCVIGDQAFAGCRALKSIEIPETIVKIGSRAFCGCVSLSNVTVHGANLRTVQEEVFSWCLSLAEVILPSSVTSIEKKAFYRCRKLHTIRQSQGPEDTGAKGASFPSIVDVGESSFEGCLSLESVALSGNIRIIHKAAFEDCSSLKDFEFPEGLEVIEEQAMAGCDSLGFARLPTSLFRIGHKAFAFCFNLQSVIMPPNDLSRLRSVGEMAFGRCLRLSNICFPSGAETQQCALDGCGTLHTLLKRVINLDNYVDPLTSGINQVGPLTTRFDGLPLLGLCYHQSYYSSEELRGRFRNVEMAGGANIADVCGMTALHLLALSRTSDLGLWKYMIEENPSNIMAMDNRGHLPLGYLLLNYCEPTVLEMYFAALHESYPFESNLEYMVKTTLPYSNDKLRSILRLSLGQWVKSLGHEQWRQAVMNEVETLSNSYNSDGRVRRASHLQCKILRKYQMKEMLSLLELAVWNIKINGNRSGSLSSTMEKEPEEFRQNCRLQCGDEVIIRNVLPFLLFHHE